VALLPVRFFSADAANLLLISLIAPARKGDTCLATSARGGWRVGIMLAVDGAVKAPPEEAERKRQSSLSWFGGPGPRMFVIRQMTEDERRHSSARTTPPKRPGRRS
jgi:hypothetical protein